MPVKYKLYKQTCQTLQQNAVQLNKRVTIKWSKVIGIALGSVLFLLFSLHWVANNSNADTQISFLDAEHLAASSEMAFSATSLATKDVTTNRAGTVQAVHSVTNTFATHTLIATPTPIVLAGPSPFTSSTVAQLTPLTTSLELQNQVAISVARVAQLLLASLAQPTLGTSSTTTVSLPATLTTASGNLPPLEIPTGDLVHPTKDDNIAVENESPPANDRVVSSVVSNVVVTTPLQWDGTVRSAQVPILMYHYLSEVPLNADIYRRDLSVTPELFSAHLDRIAAEGYTVIRLYDLAAFLLQGTPLPPKAIVLTFDDGYRDNYENALPILRKHGMTATFFVVMEFINRERPEYLTWPMVQEMAAAGMSIEAHGVDHTSLRNRSTADLEFQALRSYETLQNAIGVRAHFVSYPAGEFDEQTIDIFKEAGYLAGFTTIQGATHRSDDLFRLPRVRIRGTTTPDELAQLLALDW